MNTRLSNCLFHCCCNISTHAHIHTPSRVSINHTKQPEQPAGGLVRQQRLCCSMLRLAVAKLPTTLHPQLSPHPVYTYVSLADLRERGELVPLSQGIVCVVVAPWAILSLESRETLQASWRRHTRSGDQGMNAGSPAELGCPTW